MSYRSRSSPSTLSRRSPPGRWPGPHPRFLPATVVAAALLLVVGSPAVAQEGAVSGRVTDAESGQPVSGAQVFVADTRLGTLTGGEGRYRITGVPAGEQTVRVRLIGYRTASRTVEVAAGETVELDVGIEQTALKLQEVVVTAVAAETPRVKLPFTVEKITADELPVPAADVSSLLQGKIPGASVVSAGGAPGGASDILLRGQTSINAAGRGQGPLVVVDGVIQSTDATLADLNSLDVESIEVVKGAAAASMYGSRGQNGVIKIETKSGAALEEGPETFDLVLRAQGGRSSLPAEWPAAQFHVMRMNEGQTAFVDADGEEIDLETGTGFIEEAACGSGVPRCFQDNPYPVDRDPQGTFFDPGETTSLYGAVGAATGETNFRLSGEFFEEAGAIRLNEGYHRVNGRFNVQHSVSDEFDLQASAFAARSTRDPVAGGAGGGRGSALASIQGRSPAADIGEKRVGGQRDGERCEGGPEEDCWFVVEAGLGEGGRANPLFLEQSRLGTEERNRLMGSGRLTWSPASWLSVDGTFSYDRTDRNDESFVRRGTPQPRGGRSIGSMSRADVLQEAINASVTASLSGTFLEEELTARGKLRYLFEDEETERFSASGRDLVTRRVRTLDALRDQQSLEVGSSRRAIKAQNLFAIASLDYKDRYIVDGLVRRDGSSLFGPAERWHTYFRASGAYRVSEEPWFEVPGVSHLKLRYSIGTAGSRPRFDQRFETFTIGAGGDLTFNTLGNEGLSPEFTTEQEAGLDLTLLDRLQVTATYARSRTEGQLLPVPLPAFFGFSTQWQNAGTLVSETWEGSLEATLLEREAVTWSATLSAFTTDETITELGVPSFKYGPSIQGGDILFAREGEQLGTYYGFDFVRDCGDLETTFGIGRSACRANFDVNDHGYLVFVGSGHTWTDGPGPDGAVQTSDDLWGTSGTVGGRSFEWGKPLVAERVDATCLENDPDATRRECTTDFLPVGSSNPDVSLSLSNNVRWKGLQVYALLDAVLGFEVYNNSVQGSFTPTSRGVGSDFRGSDAVGLPAGQKKPLAYYQQWTYMGNAVNDFFAEDGSYLKVRELSVSWELPPTLLRAIPGGGGLDVARVSLTGNNLLTVTGFSGYDPEVGFGNATGETGATGSAANTRIASAQYPNLRTVAASLELTF